MLFDTEKHMLINKCLQFLEHQEIPILWMKNYITLLFLPEN